MAKRATTKTTSNATVKPPATDKAKRPIAVVASPTVGRPRKPRPDAVDGHLGLRRIEAERKRRGWTVPQLATLSHLGTGTVQRLEAGHGSPSLGTVLAIAGAFGVSAAELLADVAMWTEPAK